MPRDLDTLLAQLDLDEKVALLAGADLWSTTAVPRLGIPAVLVTDGPNGARGPAIPGVTGSGLTSVCMPCGTALGATWDPALVARVGALIGEEARRKACRVLLGPTVNLHRSPLGGRNFESYSEDPLLAGRLAAAFVRGAQSRGVACTVKHFAGNESETDRFVADSVVDERTLRELYLLPFELAVREGGALGIMTAYNRLNGVHCSDDPWLLTEVLRGEWGFEGFVVTDWFALADTVPAITAGLDLEMPGPGRAFGAALGEAVRRGEVAETVVDAALGRLLGVLDRIGALDDTPRAPTSIDLPEDRDLAREAAAEAIVLLHNDGLLPLEVATRRRVAVIGPNAARAVIMGGGSASLPVHYERTPLDAIRALLGPDVEVVHEPGVDISLTTPDIPGEWLRTGDGAPGMLVEFHAAEDLDAPVLAELRVDSGAAVWWGAVPAPVPESFSIRVRSVLQVDRPGRWTLSLTRTGPTRVLVDGAVVIDATSGPWIPGTELLGFASRELTCELDLTPARPVDIEVVSTPPAGLVRGIKLGLRPAPAADAIARAVRAATAADATILVVGTDAHWEIEGADRTSMALPGEQDELVARVLDTAPDAIVVCNTGAPVTLPWRHRCRALVQTWFGGQEMAGALAEVIFGVREPGGRLPMTWPVALEDNPSFGNFPAEAGTTRYGERVFAGYRGYDHRGTPVAFPFGHGLGYTTFELGPPVVSQAVVTAGDRVHVTVPVRNTGARAGKAVVQLYVRPPAGAVARPQKELRAFATARLDPGARTDVDLELDARSFARWSDPDRSLDHEQSRLATSVPWVRAPSAAAPRGWYVDPGRYELHIGRSCADIVHVAAVEVREAAR